MDGKRHFLFYVCAGILFFSCDKNPVIPREVLNEVEARSLIEEILLKNNSRYDNFEKRVLFSLGESNEFYVDYSITRKDRKISVINYIGENDNVSVELKNQKILQESYSIPNLYLEMSSREDITSRLDKFINQNFN